MFVAESGKADVFIGTADIAAKEKGFDLTLAMLSEVQENKPDVVVVQRPFTYDLYLAIQAIQQFAAVVVEIDDDFKNLPYASPAFHMLHKNRYDALRKGNVGLIAQPEAPGDVFWIEKSIAIADGFTCSTPGIAAAYNSPHSHVIRNVVPPGWTKVDSPKTSETDGHLRIIWTGNVEYHWNDFKDLEVKLSIVCEQTGAKFFNIGTPGPILANKVRMSVETLEGQNWLALNEPGYITEIGKADIGIVPLQKSKFNDSGKSYIKGLEYSAVGLPFVASPTDEYQYLHSLGAGILAEKERHWEKELRRLLLMSKEERHEIGEKNREVAKKLTFESVVDQYLDAWKDAVAVRKVRSLVLA